MCTRTVAIAKSASHNSGGVKSEPVAAYRRGLAAGAVFARFELQETDGAGELERLLLAHERELMPLQLDAPLLGPLVEHVLRDEEVVGHRATLRANRHLCTDDVARIISGSRFGQSPGRCALRDARAQSLLHQGAVKPWPVRTYSPSPTTISRRKCSARRLPSWSISGRPGA